MGEFAHLHLHTEYSLLDGASRIEKLFEKCVEKNMRYVAITDHGNMYGAYHFYCADKKRREALAKKRQKQNELHKREAEKNGVPCVEIPPSKEELFEVKPVIGCEMYVAEDMNSRSGRADRECFHLVLLAKTQEGYRNLIKLDSLAFTQGFYYKPRIDFNLLKEHAKGLICLSACIAGELPQLLLEGKEQEADKLVLQYKELFGQDYYIEIQDHNIAEERFVLPKLIELAKKHGVGLVATNDVHYLSRSDAEMHDILLCVQTGRFVDDTNRMRFEGSEFYLKDYDEMAELFPYAKEALDNTVKIARQCDVQIVKEKLLPNYTPENGMTPPQFLHHLMMKGLAEKYPLPLSSEILDRAKYEYGTIVEMGYVEYYLIVWDFIHYAENNGIAVGPGRGSGAGSIIAYALGITKVEPLKYNLIFERFLNPERKSMPDFDVDFCMERRGEVIKYVIDKYGKDNVAQIITFGTMAAKAAIKDVARVLRVPYQDVDKVSKLIPNGIKGNLKQIIGLEKNKEGEESVMIPEVRAIYDEDYQMKKVIDLAIQLEGAHRHASTHAAGVVICRDKISDHIPLQKNGDDVTTQFNMKEVEELGLLKIDFLGLANLTDIDKTIKLVKKTRGVTVDFSKCEYDDKKVYDLISSGETQAVFQLESPGMRRTMMELQPTCLEDIIAGISLFRPGPMQFIPEYIAGKKNSESVAYPHPMLKEALSPTYGCMVYQEQILQIVRTMAGYTYGQADIIRRAMGKKDAAEMANQRDLFVFGKTDKDGNVLTPGSKRNGISEELANSIFDKMTDFAQYAFNKSHAAGYAYIAYQTAYLKCYYFEEFITSILNNRIDKIDEIKKYVASARDKGVKVLPPHINKSDSDFDVVNGEILFGLSGVKGVGRVAVEGIIKERNQGGEFKSLRDFLSRVDSRILNKRLVENMIKGGAFDCFNSPRAEMMAVFEPLMERISADKKKRESGQFSMFDLLGDDGTFEGIEFSNIKEYGLKYKLALEKEVLGMCISGNRLDEYADKLKTFELNTSNFAIDKEDALALDALISEYDGKKIALGGSIGSINKMITKSGKNMCSAKLEDLYGSIDLLLFNRALEINKKFLIEDAVVTVKGSMSVKADDVPKIFVDKIEPWGESEGEEQKEETTLYLRMMKKDNELYEKISAVLSSYAGDVSVVLVIGSAKYGMPDKVRQCAGIGYELNALLGEGNVIFLQKKK